MVLNFTFTPEHNLEYYSANEGETYIYNLGDMAWIIVATGLVLIMIPGEFIPFYRIQTKYSLPLDIKDWPSSTLV
jgi:hypothetical protein